MIISTAKEIRATVAEYDDGEVVYDGQQYSPSPRILPNGEYIHQNGTTAQFEHWLGNVDQLSEELGLNWYDGMPYKGGPEDEAE